MPAAPAAESLESPSRPAGGRQPPAVARCSPPPYFAPPSPRFSVGSQAPCHRCPVPVHPVSACRTGPHVAPPAHGQAPDPEFEICYRRLPPPVPVLRGDYLAARGQYRRPSALTRDGPALSLAAAPAVAHLLRCCSLTACGAAPSARVRRAMSFRPRPAFATLPPHPTQVFLACENLVLGRQSLLVVAGFARCGPLRRSSRRRSRRLSFPAFGGCCGMRTPPRSKYCGGPIGLSGASAAFPAVSSRRGP